MLQKDKSQARQKGDLAPGADAVKADSTALSPSAGMLSSGLAPGLAPGCLPPASSPEAPVLPQNGSLLKAKGSHGSSKSSPDSAPQVVSAIAPQAAPQYSPQSGQWIPAETVKRWAKQLKSHVMSSKSAEITNRLLMGALTREVKGSEEISLATLVEVVQHVGKIGEDMFAAQFRGGKARTLQDTCQVWAVRLLELVARPEEQHLIGNLKAALAVREVTTSVVSPALGDMLSAADTFERNTRQLRTSLKKSLAPGEAERFEEAVGTLLGHLRSEHGSLNLGHLAAVRDVFLRRKRAGEAPPAAEVPTVERKAFLAALLVLERAILRVYLPQAIEFLEQANLRHPQLGFSHVSHIASCLSGAVGNSSTLSSYDAFNAALDATLRLVSASGLDAERQVVSQVQVALRVFGSEVSNRSKTQKDFT